MESRKTNTMDEIQAPLHSIHAVGMLHATSDASPAASQEMHFRFLELCAELRNRIYEIVLIADKPLFVPSACRHKNKPSAALPAIAKVNRQIRNECVQMFYSENKFFTHIHRCDFGYLIDFMNSIGPKNCSYILSIDVVLKDRWTCGRGILDFFRWCTKAEGTDNLLLLWDISEWNLRWVVSMDDDDQESVLSHPESFNDYMGNNCLLLNAVIEMSQKLALEQKTSERDIRIALEYVMSELDFNCSSSCVYSGYSGCPRRYSDISGICSSRHMLVDQRSVLAPGCSQFGEESDDECATNADSSSDA